MDHISALILQTFPEWEWRVLKFCAICTWLEMSFIQDKKQTDHQFPLLKASVGLPVFCRVGTSGPAHTRQIVWHWAVFPALRICLSVNWRDRFWACWWKAAGDLSLLWLITYVIRNSYLNQCRQNYILQFSFMCTVFGKHFHSCSSSPL